MGGVRHAAAQSYPLPDSLSYGSNGPNSVVVTTFTSSASGVSLTVSIYHPPYSDGNNPNKVIDSTLPTIFFSHGLTKTVGNAADYVDLLNNLASRGYNVVFSPYEYGTPAMAAQRFDELITGFEAAVTSYNLNTSSVGFVGHSVGGGFLPSTIQHEMLNLSSGANRPGHAWGSSQAFMFSMAPAYAFSGGGDTRVGGSQAINFPTNLNIVTQVYSDDTTADPRLAIDIFYNISTLNSQKDFETVYSDSHGSPAQLASHTLPTTTGVQNSQSLRAWGVFRPLDALADYTFANNATAKVIALGNGAGAEIYNGVWSDNVAVKPKTESDFPNGGDYRASPYTASWSNTDNPRLNIPLATPPMLLAASVTSGQLTNQASGLLTGRAYVEQTTLNLPSVTWSTANSFTATQNTKTFKHAVTGTPQFWRLLAQ